MHTHTYVFPNAMSKLSTLMSLVCPVLVSDSLLAAWLVVGPAHTTLGEWQERGAVKSKEKRGGNEQLNTISGAIQ